MEHILLLTLPVATVLYSCIRR